MTKAIIVIPSRLASTRLPKKPLALVQGISMIVRVWQQAMAANMGPVIVACCGEEIAEAIRSEGGLAIITDPDLPSGTDRVVAALAQFDPAEKYGSVINLQGDLPFINPLDIQKVILPLVNPDVDIATLGAKIIETSEINNPSVVKIACGRWHTIEDESIARAIYFSRQPIPANAPEFYHHVGVYAYRRRALTQYVQLEPSYLEMVEKLEQLRALEAGMRIDVTLVSEVPQSIDTPEDLERVTALFGYS